FRSSSADRNGAERAVAIVSGSCTTGSGGATATGAPAKIAVVHFSDAVLFSRMDGAGVLLPAASSRHGQGEVGELGVVRVGCVCFLGWAFAWQHERLGGAVSACWAAGGATEDAARSARQQHIPGPSRASSASTELTTI